MHPFEAAVIFCLNHIQRTGDGPAGEAAERHLAAINEERGVVRPAPDSDIASGDPAPEEATKSGKAKK